LAFGFDFLFIEFQSENSEQHRAWASMRPLRNITFLKGGNF